MGELVTTFLSKHLKTLRFDTGVGTYPVVFRIETEKVVYPKIYKGENYRTLAWKLEASGHKIIDTEEGAKHEEISK